MARSIFQLNFQLGVLPYIKTGEKVSEDTEPEAGPRKKTLFRTDEICPVLKLAIKHLNGKFDFDDIHINKFQK